MQEAHTPSFASAARCVRLAVNRRYRAGSPALDCGRLAYFVAAKKIGIVVAPRRLVRHIAVIHEIGTAVHSYWSAVSMEILLAVKQDEPSFQKYEQTKTYGRE
jgi:hypothetical protein